MATVLVTGANSFLAGNTITELLNRGYKVRGMLRKKSQLTGHNDVNLFFGNITEQEDVKLAVKGCEIVIHIASLTDQSIADGRIYENVNIGGTMNVIKASLEHKVRKVIYVSTANAFGYGLKSRPGDETLPMKAPFTASGYATSKAKAQQMTLDRLKGTGTAITVVNPTFMVGPDDNKISSNRIITRALGKKFLLMPRGGKNFIHVKDAASGICNAIEYGKDGECYILANENLTYKEFYEKMADITRHKPVMVIIPGFLLLIAGIAGNLFRYAGINTPISLTNMKILNLKNYYSSTKAVKFLKLPQTPTEKAIKEAIEWFGNAGDRP